MKNIMLLLAMAVVTASSAFGQTKQELRQIEAIDKEIKKTKKEILELQKTLSFDRSDRINQLKEVGKSIKAERDSIKRQSIILWADSILIVKLSDSLAVIREEVIRLSYQSIEDNSTSVMKKIDKKRQKISDLENERDNIFFGYATTRKAPKEVSRKELRLRQRGDIVRRQDLVLEKIEADLYSSGDSIGDSSKMGLKVIIDNEYCLPISFILAPMDGGDRKSVMLNPAQRQVVYLIPGRYYVSYMRSGNQLGENRILTVDGSSHIYKGESCFGYVYMPRY